ncbi:MAG: PorT family protein [Prevotella sp.]|nr:PorT family protein [Prevotella sp.]
MKRITLLLALWATIIGAKAQQETGTWSITPRVGVCSSVLSVDDVQLDVNGTETMTTQEVKRKWGLTAGVETQYQCWSQIGISMGLMYSNEGFQFDEMGAGGEWKQSLHFLNVPVLVNFYLEPDMLPGLALKAGVQLGYLLQSRGTMMGVTDTNTDSFHRLGVSIPAGVSYEYRNLVADLRYNIGLTNLNDFKTLDETWRCNSLWLTLGYKFRM